MHSHIRLLLPHEEDHEPTPPVVTRARPGDREVEVWFRESDDERAVLSGCPECLARHLRDTASRIEATLDGGPTG
jgi:phosphoserine phosphatase